MNSTLIIDEFSYIFEDEDRARVYIDSLRYSKASNIIICSATFGSSDKIHDYIEKISGKEFFLYENDERLTELEYRDEISIDDIRNSLVVAYSKDVCYKIALQLYRHRINKLLDMTKRAKNYDPRKQKKNAIIEIAKSYNVDNDELIELATMGVIYYCGQLLPKEKLLAEELFEKRLIDTIVGTDALALGVNFPIENVAFSQLTKFVKTGQMNISRNMFEQLSGRAGRKSFYDKGYVYWCGDFFKRDKNILSKIYNRLLKSKNEDVTISLSANIKDILLGNITIEEDAMFITNYSTVTKDYNEEVDNIKKKIDFITKLDLTSYVLNKLYNIDISNGFYNSLEGFNDKTKVKIELLSVELFKLQSIYEKDIGNVYFSEYNPKQNIDIFIDILLETPLDKLVKRYCTNDGNFNIRNLLFFRKYLRGLPLKYSKIYDLNELDKIINDIDFTILHPYEYMSNKLLVNGNKNEVLPQIKKVKCPDKFYVIVINGKKYIKILQESNRMLLCDYDKYSYLNLYYVPLNTIYTFDRHVVTSEEFSTMWPRINFDSISDTLDCSNYSDSLENFYSYVLSRKKK